MRLRTLQTGLVLGLAIPLLLFVAVLVVVLVERERDAADRGLRDTAQALMSAFDREIEDTIRSLRLLAASDDLDKGDVNFYRADLEGAVEASHDWVLLVLADAEGRPLVMARGQPVPSGEGAPAHASEDEHEHDPQAEQLPFSGADLEAFRLARTTGEPAVSSPMASFDGRPVVAVSVPVLRDREVRYILTALYDVKHLGRVFYDQSFARGWYGALVDRHGAVMVRSGAADHAVDYAGDPGFRAAVAGSTVGRFVTHTAAEPLVGHFARSPLTGWAVVLSASQAQLDASVWRLASWVALAGGALLVAGLLFAAWLSQRLSRDIRALAAPARNLGAGKLPTLPCSRVAEVRELGRELENAATLLKTLLDERDAVEERLFRSEERYRGVVELTRSAIWIHTDGVIIFANAAAARAFGAPSPEALIGRPTMSLVHPDDLALAQSRTNAIIEEGTQMPAVEMRFLRDDGGTVILEVQGTPFWYEGMTSVLAVGHDITRHRQVEDALRYSEQRFRDFADVASDWLWELGPDLRFTYVSDRVGDKGGASPEFFLGKTPIELAAPGAAGEALRAHLANLEARLPFRGLRATAIRPGGVTRHVRISGKPFFDEGGAFLGYRGASTDITPEAQIEARLRDSEQRLRDFAEVASDRLWELGPDLRFTYVSDGSAAKYLLGKTPEDLYGPATDPADVRAHLETLRARKPFRDLRMISVGSGATPRHIRVCGKPLFDERGVFLGYRGGTRDETAEAEVQAQLRQAQKMEVVGQLTGGMAHHFNNMLAVVTLNAGLLLERLDADDQRLRPLVGHIAEAGQRGAALMRHLMAFSREQALAPQAAGLNEIVRGVEPLLRRTLGEAIVIETRLGADLRDTMADVGQIETSLLQLAANARDAMPDGGRLTIETANCAFDAAAAGADGTPPGAYAMLAVSDTGTGMAPEVRERACDPFFSTKAPGKGVGLGLSAVYGFVKQSGGHIAIESAPGVGTTVRIWLPLATVDKQDDKAA